MMEGDQVAACVIELNSTSPLSLSSQLPGLAFIPLSVKYLQLL